MREEHFDDDRDAAWSRAPGTRSAGTMALTARRHDADELARWFRHLLASAGGFTWHRQQAVPIRDGIAVGADPARALCFALPAWDDARVAHWVGASTDRAAAHDLHLGGWLDAATGQVWLDLVQVFPAREWHRAVTLARVHGQHALFDLARGAVVPLEAPPAEPPPGPGRPRRLTARPPLGVSS